MTTPQGSGGEQGLPDHDTEVMAAHEGRPTVAEQALTHGAGVPDIDHGVPDAQKYA